VLVAALGLVGVGLFSGDDPDPALVAQGEPSQASSSETPAAEAPSSDAGEPESGEAPAEEAPDDTEAEAAEAPSEGVAFPLEQGEVGQVEDFPRVDLASLETPPVLKEDHLDLVEIDGWLQGDKGDFDSYKDRPATVVQFWTFGCYNCTNTLPYLRDVYSTWNDSGVEFIGVHAPEFSHERDPANVAAAAVDLGVEWPIALDTERTNFRAWQEGPNYWPRTYVLDREGQIRYDEIGEGGYSRLADTVAWLIANDSETAPSA